MSEMECGLYAKLYDMKCVCLRYFNVYSEDQEYGGAYSTVIAAWMQMLREGKSLRIDGDGNQSRDFIHVNDIVSANIYCMENIDKLEKLWYDVGYGETCTLNQIKKIVDKFHSPKWKNSPPRKGDVRHTEIGHQRLQVEGWQPDISLTIGLEKCFKK